MSSESCCAQCGATTYADALDGLCVACVGRGILRVEFSPADLSGTKSGSVLASFNEAEQSAQLDPQPGSATSWWWAPPSPSACP